MYVKGQAVFCANHCFYLRCQMVMLWDKSGCQKLHLGCLLFYCPEWEVGKWWKMWTRFSDGSNCLSSLELASLGHGSAGKDAHFDGREVEAAVAVCMASTQHMYGNKEIAVTRVRDFSHFYNSLCCTLLSIQQDGCLIFSENYCYT